MAEKEKIKELLESSSENNYVKANQIFNELISLKVKEILDVGKSIMADEIYNIVEGPPQKNTKKNSKESGGLYGWAKDAWSRIGDKRSDEEKKKDLEDKKKESRSKQGKQDQDIPKTEKQGEASRVPAPGKTAPAVRPKMDKNVRKSGEELVPSKGPGRQDKEGSSSAQPEEPKKQPTKKIKPETALEKVRRTEKEKRDAKKAAQEKQKNTVYDDDPSSGTASRAAQREQEKAIKKDNKKKVAKGPDPEKQDKDDIKQKPSGPDPEKQDKDDIKQKPGLSPGALGGKAKPGLSPGALGGKAKTKPSGKGKPGDHHPPGKRKPGEIYQSAKDDIAAGRDPNKTFKAMSKEKRMKRALGTTKNQDERIAAAKAGATNQDFKSNLDRYRRELGQTKPKAKEWVNPDAPKKPARKLGLSPGALGGRAKPGLSPGAMGGKAKPAQPKKPAPKPGLSPGAMGGKAKPGLSPGALGGKAKPVKKPRTTPNMAPQE